MADNSTPEDEENSIRERLWRIIFQADTPGGRTFDIILLWLIGASVIVVMLESVVDLRARYQELFYVLEWIFTILFTIEYAFRIWVVRRKSRYIFSFFGIVDLLSILPSYIGLFLTGSGYLIVIRILRLLRMFRILKMAHHMGQANILLNALKNSRPKMAVFMFGVLALISIEGTIMYIIEDSAGNAGFSSIPQAIYWGIVTITTVGYGDVAPITVAGKILASIIMLTGFSIIAVPTGIVGVDLYREMEGIRMDRRECKDCGLIGHDPKALYCKHCGTRL